MGLYRSSASNPHDMHIRVLGAAIGNIKELITPGATKPGVTKRESHLNSVPFFTDNTRWLKRRPRVLVSVQQKDVRVDDICRIELFIKPLEAAAASKRGPNLCR